MFLSETKGWDFALFTQREAIAVRSGVDQRATRNQSPSDEWVFFVWFSVQLRAL